MTVNVPDEVLDYLRDVAFSKSSTIISDARELLAKYKVPQWQQGDVALLNCGCIALRFEKDVWVCSGTGHDPLEDSDINSVEPVLLVRSGKAVVA